MSAVEKLSSDGLPRQAKMFSDVAEDRGDRAYPKCIAHVAASLARDPVAQCRQGARKVIP